MGRTARRVFGLAVLLVALMCSPAQALTNTEVIEQARLDAIDWWQQQGAVLPCDPALYIGADLPLQIVAQAQWANDPDPDTGGYGPPTDCTIGMSDWFLKEVFAPQDRLSQRVEYVALWLAWAHEYGHLFENTAEHSHEGIMQAELPEINPPARAIEWAISMTRRKECRPASTTTGSPSSTRNRKGKGRAPSTHSVACIP